LGVFDSDDEDGFIPQARVLDLLIGNAQSAIAEAPEAARSVFLALLEDIAYTVHKNGSLDTATLKNFLFQQLSTEHAEEAISEILQAAFELNAPAEPRELSYLSQEHPLFSMNALTTVPLLAHAVLGTLSAPEGNHWGVVGFNSWYCDAPRHPLAVDGYLRMLFDYFLREPQKGCSGCTFQIQYAHHMPDPMQCSKIPDITLKLVQEIQEPSSASGGFSPFVLVAANKEPGPGPTGTQEERLQASSPWLVLASLLCPSIPDDAVIVTSALPLLGSWTGHNRTATLAHVFDKDKRPRRRYILADALPLDEICVEEGEKLPDLRPDLVHRELRKLYAAFSGALNASKYAQLSECIIEAPPWGCGAFGGNLLVKMQIMMVAAGLAGVTVVISVTEDRQDEVAQLRTIQSQHPTVAQLWEHLNAQCDR
jgi:hypothetical protein